MSEGVKMGSKELLVSVLALAVSVIATAIAAYGARRGAILGRQGVEAAQRANDFAEKAHRAAIEHHDVDWAVAVEAIDYLAFRNLGTSTAIEVTVLVRPEGFEEVRSIELGSVSPAEARKVEICDSDVEIASTLELMRQLDEHDANVRRAAANHELRSLIGENLTDGELTEDWELFDLDEYITRLERRFEERSGLTLSAARRHLKKLQNENRVLEVALRWKSDSGREYNRPFERFSFGERFHSKADLERAAQVRRARDM